MRRIAFAYKDVLPDLAPTYRTLGEGLARNVVDVFGQKPIHIRDAATPLIEGCDELVLDDTLMQGFLLPMTWRLAAQKCCHTVFQKDEILFTEPDVRFKENVLDVFDQDFDVAITDREPGTTVAGEPAEAKMPYTQGCTFSRSREFWAWTSRLCSTYERKRQLWFGDMLAVAAGIGHLTLKFEILPAETYNHVPVFHGDVKGKVQHYKGKRKEWLFPRAKEAA